MNGHQHNRSPAADGDRPHVFGVGSRESAFPTVVARAPRPCVGGTIRTGETPVPLSAGWTAIEMIAVLSVIAILAAAVVPTIIRRVDRAAWTSETANLTSIADAFIQSVVRTKTIPNYTDWPAAIAVQASMPVSAVTINPRRYPRAFLVDPTLDINGAGLPYGPQTINGSATAPFHA